MSETLYRKYRPKNFSEVIGQTHIVRTLSNSVKNDRVAQAYLFTGPRGTGKTSIARILAKTVNCEKLKDGQPCEKCSACQNIDSKKSLEIIEIDAASNTGVDNIRELRETVALANASLKYKVYIIDEVHMLSGGAWNALLKTLEEPPSHVIFILATTEIHKVPETIISRCQRFDFSRLPLADIIKKMTLIAKAEKVKIEKEALEIIAISAEGGMRDAESLLGQIISMEDKNITAKEVEELLGATDKKTAREIAKLIIEKDSTSAIAKINELLEDGYDLQIFNKALINYLRQLMLLKISPELKKYFVYEMPADHIENLVTLSEKAELPQIISAIDFFLEAKSLIASSVLPQLPLEIAIIKATKNFPAKISGGKIEYSVSTPIAPSPTVIQVSQKSTPDSSAKTAVAENSPQNSVPSKPTETPKDSFDPNIKVEISTVRENWNKLLVDIRPFNHSLAALLCNVQPQKVTGAEITLATPYDFYRERLAEHKNKLTVEEVFSKILGVRIHINIIQDKSLVIRKKDCESGVQKPSEQESLLSSALEIMGGKVIEE